MKIKVSSLTTAMSNSLSIAIVTIAFAIFVVDTQVDVDIDIPVLYVAVVLMSIRLYEVRGVLIVSMGCAVLTLAGYWLSPGDLAGATAIANRFLAFLAIGATTFLGLRNRSAQMALHQAQTELAHATRVTALGEMTASIAHEVNQPLAAVVRQRRGLFALARPRNSRPGRSALLRGMYHQRRQSGERGDPARPGACEKDQR